MYSLLVLGIIPGTDIQISFQMWLEAAAAASFLFILIKGFATLLRRPIEVNEQPALEPAVRVPLHASQLHRPA